jgi:casein kinase II subunit alpha
VLDEEQNQVLAAVHIHIDEQDLRKPFSLVEDEEVTQEDKDFICRTMQLDPRDRPTADELLADRRFGLP